MNRHARSVRALFALAICAAVVVSLSGCGFSTDSTNNSRKAKPSSPSVTNTLFPSESPNFSADQKKAAADITEAYTFMRNLTYTYGSAKPGTQSKKTFYDAVHEQYFDLRLYTTTPVSTSLWTGLYSMSINKIIFLSKPSSRMMITSIDLNNKQPEAQFVECLDSRDWRAVTLSDSKQVEVNKYFPSIKDHQPGHGKAIYRNGRWMIVDASPLGDQPC